MEAWWVGLDDTIQADWLRCWEAGRVDPDLVDTLPLGQRDLAAGRWVHVEGVSVAGQPDARIAFGKGFYDFIGEEYDRRREE